MRILYFLLLPLVGVAAEPPTDLPPSQPVEPVAKEAKADLSKPKEERGQRNQALAKLRAGKPDDTENLLGALSPAAKDSSAWHFELAMNLIRTAYDARSVGDEAAAKKAAQRAVKQLEKAERGYKEQPARLSGMQELRGVLQEDFLGTTEEAEGYFREAARLNPASETAKERVGRLDRNRKGNETNLVTPSTTVTPNNR